VDFLKSSKFDEISTFEISSLQAPIYLTFLGFSPKKFMNYVLNSFSMIRRTFWGSMAPLFKSMKISN